MPFATIPARFRRAGKLPGETVDATNWKTYPAQPQEDRISETFSFVKNHFAEEEQRTRSEDTRFISHVVTPNDAIRSKKLPVMVWIYGPFPGRTSLIQAVLFAFGSNSKGLDKDASFVELVERA